MQVFPWGRDWLFPQPEPCREGPCSSRSVGACGGGWAPAPSGDVHVHRFGLCGRLVGAFQYVGRFPGRDGDAFPVGEVESGKRLCVVPGGKKGTEERHMGHASHVLCMAISSDGKYLVRERGLVLPCVVEGCWWGVHLLLGSCGERYLVPRCTLLASSSPYLRWSQEGVPGTPQSTWGGSIGWDVWWVLVGQVLGIPCVLPGYGRQEQADHGLGHRHLQAPAHLHWAPRCRLGESGTLAATPAGPGSTALPGAPHHSPYVRLSVCRACPSGRARTSCTVPPMTAASRSGTWRRTHTWRPCKSLGKHTPH